jgi:hypothetical protein
MQRIKIYQEDQRLVELAVFAAGYKVPVSIGVPSPPQAATPGGYFGAMTILKWLTQEGFIDPEAVHLKMKQVIDSQDKYRHTLL